MSQESADQPDEYGKILEQLKKVQAAIRVCIRAIQDSKNRAWEWRDRRDDLHSVTPQVHEQISEQRSSRDELNVEVQHLKQLRDQENERARVLQLQLKAQREKNRRLGKTESLEELQKRYRDLEWQQQTSSLSMEEEKRLLTELEELAATIERVKELEREIGEQNEGTEALWEEIQAARDQAQEYHEKMTALVEEAQQKHQSITQLSESLGPAKGDIDEAHQMFVQCLQEADEMKERLEELKSQEKELRDRLDALGNRRREARATRERDALEKLAAQAREKQQAGQKLTMQELRALMETGSLE